MVTVAIGSVIVCFTPALATGGLLKVQAGFTVIITESFADSPLLSVTFISMLLPTCFVLTDTEGVVARERCAYRECRCS